MECPNCRNTIPDTSTFCAYCGATITAPGPQPAAAPAAASGTGSSRRWLFIGGGVLAAVAVVVVAFVVMGGSPGDSDSGPSQAVIPAPPLPTDTSGPPAAVPPLVPPQATPASSAAPTAPAPAGQPAVSDETVIFSDLNWTSVQVQNRIAQYIIEHGYGYPTAVVSGGTTHLFQSLRRGDIHVTMEIWLPLQENAWREAQANGEVQYVGSSLGSDWQSTFVIPAYLQEEYPGLDHVDDLKDPRYRELFATATTDGKARLIACVFGWACQEGNDAQIAGYGLDEHLKVIRPDSQEAMFAEVYGAYAKGKPWLGYMWGTADPSLLLDLVRLEEPPYSDECWFTTKACSFKDTTILTAVHSGLPGRAPALVHLLEQWAFDIGEYQSVLRWMDDNDATVEEAALNWLRKEGETWKFWVTEAAYVGVQAALAAAVDAEGWPGR